MFERFLIWRRKHITERVFLLIICFIVGVLTALSAHALKMAISFIQSSLTKNFDFGANYYYLLLPVIGILIAGLYVKFVVKDDISHGITKVLFSISQRKSRI